MNVRKVDTDELEAVLSVINRTNREAYKEIISKEYFQDPILTFEELLEELRKMTFYACWLKGKIVGVAALKIESPELGRIQRVYVLPEHQRKGIGTLLIKHIEHEARKNDLKRLTLVTNEKTYWALNFYVKLGYRRTGTVERPWSVDAVFEKTL